MSTESFSLPPTRKVGEMAVNTPSLQVRKPIIFENYNYGGSTPCQGFGLKCLDRIDQGDVIVRMKTEMGLVSSSFIDNMGDDPRVKKEDINHEENAKYDQLVDEITKHTAAVATNLTLG